MGARLHLRRRGRMLPLMFIDALTPHEPVPTTVPKPEHETSRLGTTAAEADAHARVHGDGSTCPICRLQVSSPQGPLPNPAAAVVAAFSAALHLS